MLGITCPTFHQNTRSTKDFFEGLKYIRMQLAKYKTLDIIKLNCFNIINMLLNSSEFSVRSASAQDIPALVDIDMISFRKVYEEYPSDSDSLKAELVDKFTHRHEILGSEWTSVLEQRGEPVGFMTSCPTHKTPESFVSWEETTNNGTLDGTFNSEGDNVYVTSLSVLPKGTSAKGMLFAHQLGNSLKGGYKEAFFESRMPGLRNWLKSQCAQAGVEFETLAQEQVQSFAEQYFQLNETINPSELPHDRLLRLYKSIGCTLLKLVPDAYQDAESLNYGVLCTYNFEEQLGNIISSRIAKYSSIRKFAGYALRATSHSELMSKHLF